RLIIGLQSPRDVGQARIGVRLLEKIDNLSAQISAVVNHFSAERDVAEEILPAFVNRQKHVNRVRLFVNGRSRLVDLRVEKTFRDVKTLDQTRAFLHVRLHIRQILLQLRVTFPRRSDDELE